jgi:hypothetical protein
MKHNQASFVGALILAGFIAFLIFYQSWHNMYPIQIR